MKPPLRTAVVVGVGELGGEFALALLRRGCVVVPVTRSQNLTETLEATRSAELVLLAVGESALGPLLESVPPAFRDRVALVQNELVPADWQQAGIAEASGVVVWFEKKAGRAIHVVRPSVVYGPRGNVLLDLLGELEVPAYAARPGELEFELALKNLYILVHNLAGLTVGGTVGDLWREHAQWAHEVANDVFAHQEARLRRTLDRRALLEQLERAVHADPGHGLAGRTAPERLARVLAQGRKAGLQLSVLEKLNRRMNESPHA